MDTTSKPSSNRPWLWVIEALARCSKIDNSALQGIIDVAPVVPSDFGENTKELISRRALEGLFPSAGGLNLDASSSLDSRLGSISRSCEAALHQTLFEIPKSSPGIAGVEILKRDVYPFMTHRRSLSMNLELQQLKESVIKGTHPCADLLKQRSGLTFQNQDVHLKEPNAAHPNPTRQSISCDEDIFAFFNDIGAEHPEMSDFAAEKHELFSSHYRSRHDRFANSEWRDQNLCLKCNKGDQLLVCKTTACLLKVHDSCLSKPAQFDEKGNFLCPFCAYSRAVSEYLEEKKKAVVAREELCVFLGGGNNSSIKDKGETVLVKDNGNKQVLGTAREDNQVHVNGVSNLQFERSEQQAETPLPCDNVPPLCRKKGIVNKKTEKYSVLNGGEETDNTKNPKTLCVEGSLPARDRVTAGGSSQRQPLIPLSRKG